MSRLSHIDASGRARMVDVSDKPVTAREAVAEGRIRMTPETRALAISGAGKKGEVLATASRVVTALSETSTMRARPVSSMWVSLLMLP